ncbi:MAG: sialidase family protein [Verrucomicrobiota bacterium]
MKPRLLFSVLLVPLLFAASPPPGVIIDRSPDFERVYVACPSIAILPDGSYAASHSWFGPGTTNDTTEVFTSTDRGATWTHRARVLGQWWSTLFVHRGQLYLLGVDREYGRIVIRRSGDGGLNWTTPVDDRSGRLTVRPGYHGAPVPVLAHGGRLWRAFELAGGPAADFASEVARHPVAGGYNTGVWGDLYIRPRLEWSALVLSAAEDADLLRADAWRFSEPLAHAESASQWIEGNVLPAPGGRLVNLLRTNPRTGTGAPSRTSTVVTMVDIVDDGRRQTWAPATAVVTFPGGGSKFTIRHDARSGRYWSLPNLQADPAAYRSIVVLASSADLRAWRVEATILQHPEPRHHAWQYLDWQFDGEDLIAVSRTAWEGSRAAHDANYFTFHRIAGFRSRGAAGAPGSAR